MFDTTTAGAAMASAEKKSCKQLSAHVTLHALAFCHSFVTSLSGEPGNSHRPAVQLLCLPQMLRLL
jgi:hypothetical protein